jgi:2'-hydroxyisoflavone reductase
MLRGLKDRANIRTMQNRRDFITATLAAVGTAAFAPDLALARPAPKTILILGGTGFVGPHQVRRALERGHQVTVFNRGRSAPGMFGKDAEELVPHASRGSSDQDRRGTGAGP